MADVTSDQEQKKFMPAVEPVRSQPATEAPLPDWGLPPASLSTGPGLGAPDGYAQRLGDGRLAQNANRESRVRLVTALQRQLGNQHVQRLMAGQQVSPVQRQGPGEAQPLEEPAKEAEPPFELNETGVTTAEYHDPSASTKNVKVKPFIPPKDVKPEDDLVDVSATAVCVFTVTVTIDLPTPPTGMSKCQTQRVQEAIDKKLKPHEAAHKAAMKTYEGTSEVPFELKQIQRSTVDAALSAKVVEIATAQAATRKKTAQDASDKLDKPPFIVNVDLNCEDKKPAKKQSAADGEAEPAAATGVEQPPSQASAGS